MQRTLDYLKDDLPRVEARFTDHLESDVPLIRKIGEYILARGGKRLRPMLVLLCAKLSGYTGEADAPLASVVEFIHTATLLHDDVVDGASLRRGNTSANALWGNEASVLVGDFLFAKSFSLMVGFGDLRVLEALSDATTRMAEGEVLQLISTCDVELEEARYLDVVQNKTAILISAACQVGGILGKVPSAEEEALKAFGMELGVAFQLMDDALDYVADQQEFGKARGHDLQEGKMTLPLIHALRSGTPEEKQAVAAVIEQEELAPEELERVFRLIEHYDGIGYTRACALQRVEAAKRHLQIFPPHPARESLFELADYVITRRK